MTDYSIFSSDLKKSKGRMFLEEEDVNRSCFMRDRDRIIHSSAFRRLKYKTQVFVYNKEDYYRTRLSHSIEVSQLARSIAKVFKVNDDLAESISLSHDLGHTPFGHAGEDELSKKMKAYGGFNHNYQALKILTSLEKKYLKFDGLNLTFETLDGILKHNGPIKNQKVPIYIQNFINFFKGDLNKFGSFESQLSSICDDIAYNNNDIDDGLYAKFFDLEELEQLKLVKKALGSFKIQRPNNARLRYELVRKLIKLMIDDLIKNTQENLKKFKILSANDIVSLDKSVVCFSDSMKKNEIELKKFLKEKMYMHPKIRTMTLKAKRIISDLFDLFISESDLLPEKWKKFNNKEQRYFVVCDYISGMTDKYAINTHKKFFDLYNF
ncbi:MAG: deoxyguanosinetriphosphate triphosphohydrolase [alpha proteobacterium MED-G10]|nr:MAG: deoxyguanosinetriphosphate triphosphohydrolase [alpha proteobacterium MED-G10]|tara:strand:+ start:3175 stop:4314 length:1140 start_codon:yes stop_codon:yes gene_type:complete